MFADAREKLNGPIHMGSMVNMATYVICAMVLLLVYSHIRLPFLFLFTGLFCLSLYLHRSKGFEIPRWFLNLLSLAVVVFSIYRLDINDLVPQMMEALLILISIKLLERKQVRDYLQVYAMALLLLASVGLLSLSITFILYFVFLTILLTTTVVLLTFYSQDHNLSFPRKIMAKVVVRSLWIPIVAVPLTLFMFVILPRAQYPLLNFLNRDETAKTGFTDNVKLGGVAGIQEDSSVIFRVTMDRIEDEHLYWRGIVLDHFDGSSWTRSQQSRLLRSIPPLVKGRSIKQTVYLEPYGNHYVFSLDKPAFVSLRGIRKNHDLTYSALRFIDKRMRYEAISLISDRAFQADADTSLYLQVPDRISPKIIKLVRELTAGQKAGDRIVSLQRFFDKGGYRYSLQNLPVSGNALEEFLFEARYGNCEYFASAFAVMLRIAGIPARLVGGYRGGYYNDVGGYYLVPQKNAHVWVEAYHDRYWVRLDPTPAAMEGFTALWKGSLLLRASLLMDTINYYWYALVINYNFEKQRSLLNSMRSGIKKRDLRFPAYSPIYLKYFLILVVAGGALFAIRAILVERKDKGKRLLNGFFSRMEAKGYKKPPAQGLEEFLTAIPDVEVRQRAESFVRAFEAIYFKDRIPEPQEFRTLKGLLKGI